MRSILRQCHSLAALSVVFLNLAVGSAAPQHEFYVSPEGSDADPGTRSRPFKTIMQARDAVRMRTESMQSDIVVFLHGGTYHVTSPIEFSVADSGRNGYKVIYRAYGEETPVISGGVAVRGWTAGRDGLYKATFRSDHKLRSLYVNGMRADLAAMEFSGRGAWGRFVIKGDEPWAETSGETLDGIAFSAAEVPVLAQAEDVELAQYRVWNSLVVGVLEIVSEGDRTIVKLQQPYGAIAATLAWDCGFAPDKSFVLRNAIEFLKTPGQFYFNRATDTLYYYPRPGENMVTAEVIAPVSEGLLRIAGESTGKRVENLEFHGLTFSYDHWLLQEVAGSRGLVGVQSLALYTKFRADGNWHKTHYNVCDLPQATVELRSCRNVRFERNRFLHLTSGAGVSLVNDVSDTAVTGNVFDGLSGNAVNVGHPQHYAIGDGALFSSDVEGVCARISINNNWIRRVSLDFKQEEAISGFFTDGVEIAHNDIRGTPYGGIALGWWWGNAEIPPSTVAKNNRIFANRVVETQQVLHGDGGAIYVLGEQPGSRIEANYIESSTRMIYCDDGSAYWTVTRNVVKITGNQSGELAKGKHWLNLWTPRIHDLTIVDNYTNSERMHNAGTNCTPRDTHVGYPFPDEAQAIIAAAGLEPAYQDIAKHGP
jgi:hypothetical protein